MNMRNRWGIDVRRGDFVTYQPTRGKPRTGVVASFDKTSAFAKAYGVQVSFDDGGSCGIDDISRNDGKFSETMPGLLQRGNPAKRRAKAKTTRARRTAVAGKFNSPSLATGLPPSSRLVKRRKETAHAPPGIYANPSRVSVNAPSMATGKRPTTRLVQRRMATDKAPWGYYANPTVFRVESQRVGYPGWLYRGSFPSKAAAEQYARAFHAAHSDMRVRVIKPEPGRPMMQVDKIYRAK